MGVKSGFIIGFGAGYVLGARAGRQRYEQISQWWGQLTGSPAFQKVTERTKEAAGEGAKKSLFAVQRGVEKAGTAVKDRLSKEDDLTEEIADRLEEERGRSPGQTEDAAPEVFPNTAVRER
jgi:hypothetical protein